MTTKELIIRTIADRGFELIDIKYTPHQGWFIELSKGEKPIRGSLSVITAYNRQDVFDQLDQIEIGYEYCPECGIGLSYSENQNRFCLNCRCDFSFIDDL